jgi:hypothetical protein
MNEESIYNRIKELFGKFENFNILEEQIDLDLQMKYFDFSKKVKEEVKDEDIDIDEMSKELYKKDLSQEKKKRVLALLASVEDVAAYRILEEYAKNSEGEMRNWSILAFQENRMLLQSKLLDENQVFISTGLGGKGSKLRYFIVLMSKSGENFSSKQRQLIQKEFEYSLKEHDIEIEEMHFNNNISTILALIPIEISVKEVFTSIIGECNKYGNFLMSNFIVTNVKQLSYKEINQFLDEYRDNELKEEKKKKKGDDDE